MSKNPTPLTRAELDLGRCANCDDPTHAHEPLYLHPRCHPGAEVTVSYHAGVLTVGCAFATCGKLVTEIAVAE